MRDLEEKKCSKCEKIQPITEFYPHEQCRDKHTNICKSCEQIRHREYYLKNKAKVALINKNWRINNPEKHRKSSFESIKKWKKHNVEAAKAHQLVNNHILRKKNLVPINCEKCGDVTKLQAHHEDYSKPFDIMWLCKKCHLKKHNRVSFSEAKGMKGEIV